MDDRNKGKITCRCGARTGRTSRRCAALFEPAIKEVVVVDPPLSHMNGPHFLNVLRMLDVPEALGTLGAAAVDSGQWQGQGVRHDGGDISTSWGVGQVEKRVISIVHSSDKLSNLYRIF